MVEREESRRVRRGRVDGTAWMKKRLKALETEKRMIGVVVVLDKEIVASIGGETLNSYAFCLSIS